MIPITQKLTLFLMTYKGHVVLQSLIKEIGKDFIDFVVVSRDKNISNDYYAEINALCKESGINVMNRNEPYTVQTKYIFAVSWRWLINLDSDKSLIVLHDSILPKYRGFAPLVSYLINEEKEIGVTALFASEEYDKGEIIMQSSSLITYPIKIKEAIEMVTHNYIELALAISKMILAGTKIISHKQKEEEASYSLWRDEDDYKIDWNLSAQYIKRFIDAVGEPYNFAYTILNNQKVRVRKATVVKDVTIENRTVGKVIFINKGFPLVVCGTGLLQIDDLVDEEKNNLLPLKNFRSRFK